MHTYLFSLFFLSFCAIAQEHRGARPLPTESTPVYANTAEAALIRAAAEGDAEAVRKHLSGTVNVLARDALGDCALAAAVRGANIEIVRLLLRRGASPDVLGRGGYSALGLAAMRGYAEIARALIDAGADVAIVSAHGNRPLHDAVVLNRVDIVKLLLAHGARADATDQQGRTPLALALAHGHEATAKLLRAAARSRRS